MRGYAVRCKKCREENPHQPGTWLAQIMYRAPLPDESYKPYWQIGAPVRLRTPLRAPSNVEGAVGELGAEVFAVDATAPRRTILDLSGRARTREVACHAHRGGVRRLTLSARSLSRGLDPDGSGTIYT
ncbi:MAG: hypothetical protein WD232_08395 [Acidimicrobiales bacterium]